MLKKIMKKFVYYAWVINGYVGWRLGLPSHHKLTILITYYNPVRVRHVNHQIRNLLKCNYVDRVIISCHNPDLKIEDHVKVTDQRLVFLNQPVRRPCGYRWSVACEFSPEYLIVIDDDILLFPGQVKILFKHLIQEPKVPHGLSGMIRMEKGDFQFHQRENIDVHYLCEVYAVTKDHVEQYFEMTEILEARDRKHSFTGKNLGDFIVISQTGPQDPKIHKVGHILRDDTFNKQGVASHKEKEFQTIITGLSQAVKDLRTELFA